MITIVHDKYIPSVALNDDARMVLGQRYFTGKAKPNYPMPAIPLEVKYDYLGCVNIDDVTDENDPIIVYMYDSWTGQNV